MINLTLDEVKRLSDAAIAERGEDYVYANTVSDGCYYVHRSDCRGNPVDYLDHEIVAERVPGCHVGDVLIRAGIDPKWFDDHEGESAWAVIDILERGEILSVDYRAEAYFSEFQGRQDSGAPWGCSRDLALEFVEKHYP